MALTRGLDWTFRLAAVLISSRSSNKHPKSASLGEAADANAAAVPVAAG